MPSTRRRGGANEELLQLADTSSYWTVAAPRDRASFNVGTRVSALPRKLNHTAESSHAKSLHPAPHHMIKALPQILVVS